MSFLEYISTFAGSATVAVIGAVITAVVLESVNKSLMQMVRSKPWWPNAIPLQKALMMNFGYTEETLDEESALDSFAFVLLICGNHFFAGCSMLPVVCLGWEGAGYLGQVMFLLGGLTDVAFDLYDAAKKTALLCFPTTFKSLGPPTPLPFFIMLCGLHHPLAMTMIIPMNVYYNDLRAYHFIAVSLLLAAGICFLSGQYKFTLDTTKKNGFIQYKVIVVLQFVTIWFTRGAVWFPQVYVALSTFYAKGDMPFFVGGCVGSLAMTLFNVVMLMDSTTAAIKWLPKPMPQDEASQSELKTDIVQRQSNFLTHGGTKVFKMGAKEFRSTVKVAVAANRFKKGLHKEK